MARVIRTTGWVFGGLLLLAALVVIAAVLVGERKAARKVTVTVAPLAPLPANTATLARGQYLFATRGCAECHGSAGTGSKVIDDPNGMLVRAPDITAGNPAVRDYRAEDWVRAVRHGVDPSGRALMVMPSEDFNRMSDEDLGALVAWIRQLPPGPGAPAEVRLPWLVRALYGVGVVKDAAEKIDHTLPPQAPVPMLADARYGAYVANTCQGCHGAGLRGGKIPGAPPDWPAAADLRPGAGRPMSRYDDAAKFISMFRTGQRPDGSTVSRVMPFAALGRMNDTELNALYLYLTGLPEG